MPRLPDVQTYGPRPTTTPQRQIVGYDTPSIAEAEAMAPDLAPVGNVLNEHSTRAFRRQDVIAGAHARNQLNADLDSELLRLSTEDDLSRDATMVQFGTFMGTRKKALLAGFTGGANARAELAADFEDISARYAGKAGALGARAALAAVERSVTESVAPLISEAAVDPAGIDDLLRQGDRIVARAAPALAPDQENSMRAALRDQIAGSAVDAMLLRGDVDGAEAAMGTLSGALTADSQAAFRRQIAGQRAAQQSTEREIAQAERLLGRPLTQAELATKLGLAKAPLVQIDTGSRQGPVAPGHVRVPDANDPSGFRDVQVGGSPAQLEAEGARLQAAVAREDNATKGRIMVRDLDRSIALLDGGAGGATAVALSRVPGTDDYQLGLTLESVKARVTFEALQEMRNNSPTGGALGNVSDTEGRLLASVKGSLEVGQDPKILRENLETIRELQLNAIYGTPAERVRAVASGSITQEQADQLASDRETKGLGIIAQATAGEAASGGHAEGTIATNPATGESVILRGGRWEPI